MMIPPIVGVPAFSWWPSGPSSRMCWPNSRSRRNSMKRGDRKMQMSRAAVPRDQDLAHQAPSRLQRLGHDLEADAARALDAAPCRPARSERRQRARPPRRRRAARRPPRSRRRSARPAGRRRRAASTPAAARVGADLGVEARLVGPELEHVPEHGDPAPGRGRGEVVECGAHRHRVGVVAVVDDDDAAGELDPLAAEARERDVAARPRARRPGRAPRRAPRARCGACARS